MSEQLATNSQTYKIIKNDISCNMLNHAYMIVSFDSYFMDIVSTHITKMIMCDSAVACNNCSNCKKIAAGIHADVAVFPKNKKMLTVEESRFILNDSIVKPYEGERKIYIINNFDKATTQAQNALLKTLEEPSKNVIFIITATNEQNVLPTIKSRVKIVREGKLKDELLINYLKKINASSVNLDKIVAQSGGNLSKSLELIKAKSSEEMMQLAFDIFNNMQSSSQVLDYSNKVMQYKDELENFLQLLHIVIRELFVAKVDVAFVYNQQSQADFSRLCVNYNEKVLCNLAKKVNSALQKLRANCSGTAVIDGMLMDILEVKYLWQK